MGSYATDIDDPVKHHVSNTSSVSSIIVHDVSCLNLIYFLKQFKDVRLSVKISTDHYIIKTAMS